jgi:hypothetical protein
VSQQADENDIRIIRLILEGSREDAKAKQIIDVVETDGSVPGNEWFSGISILFRGQPFYETPDFKVWLNHVIADDSFRDIIHKEFQ